MLRELPLVTPLDYYFDDEQPNQKSTIKLFENEQQSNAAAQIMNSTDPYLADLLSRTLMQIDTSKMY